MTSTRPEGGLQEVYDFWLGLLPQFFGQLGAGVSGNDSTRAASAGLSFPSDQIARAATMTQDALQALGRTLAPVLQVAGAPGLLSQWAAAMPPFPGMQAPSSAPAGALPGMPDMFAPWTAAMSFFPGAQNNSGSEGGSASVVPGMTWPWPMTMPFAPAATGNADAAKANAANAAAQPMQAMQQAWLDAAARMTSATPQLYASAFERTFGGVSDALGFGPIRKLQAAWQELLATGMAQNETRMAYAMLVQGAFTAGLDGLLQRLAAMADAGERVDSVLALLRLWAIATEDAVHQVLQSEKGLAATAALSRAGVAHRKKVQHIADIVADSLDMATRRDLDEAFREIQALKRELRAQRAPVPAGKAPAKVAARTVKRKKK